MRKPSWLNKKISLQELHDMKKKLRGLKLHTVCEGASCPNRAECFNNKTATFMIMGDICTRGCKFCGVAKAKPLPIDADEPKNVSTMVKQLGLEYVVITCVTRDDILDGGAKHFCDVINTISDENPSVRIEILTSDFYSSIFSTGEEYKNLLKFKVEDILKTNLSVFGHNLETVERIYPLARRVSDYKRSLNVLKTVKEINSNMITKSSFMLGLGESLDELLVAMQDLLDVGCDIVTFGQYLAPSKNHYPVEKYWTVDEFNFLENKAYEMGFRGVCSGPYVRSSYKANEIYEKVMNDRGENI